jgi:hypothetical protein
VINFRFHLISLVAVFLALGVGVAMGASFVDRATVDTLRGRVDDLADGYRRRGDELDATKAQLTESDTQAAALAGEASEALATRLKSQPVVVVATDGVPGEVLESTRTSLAAAGAPLSGVVRLQPALSLQDEGVLRRVRDRLGLRTGGVSEVRARVVSDLGTALAVLGGGTATGTTTTTAPATTGPTTTAPGGAPGTTTTAPATTSGSSDAVVVPPTDVASSRAMVAALVDLGLVTVDTSNAPATATFPDAENVRYVLVTAPGDRTDTVVIPLATSIGRQAPAVLTVAEARVPRPEGEATTTTQDQPARGELVKELREGELADRVSTVDDLEESFGRIALVFTIAQQHDSGTVGHYGTGSGATAPFPTVPPG